MTDLLLVTLPARFLHTPFALYRLKAALGDLEPLAAILELTPEEAPEDSVARLLAAQPRVVAFSVYVWNVDATLAVSRVLRAVAPEVAQIVGGPQIVASADPRVRAAGFSPPRPDPADYAISGEGELEFAELCRALLAGERPAVRWIEAAPVDVRGLASPYRLYTDTDLRHRILYVETLRGCPHRCAYCTSATQAGGLRRMPLKPLFADFDALIARGARAFKLLDRSFDADVRHACAVLDGFLKRLAQAPDLRLHLEWVPDHLPELLLERLRAFPPGALHLELGVQTLDAAVARRIGRQIHPARVLDNLRRLAAETRAELHLDLIVGLPGETVEGFAQGFERLAALQPHALQVNLLKRLPGTLLDHQAEALGLHFSPQPPYPVLASDAMTFGKLLGLRRFAYVWDRVYNRETDARRRARWCAPPGAFDRVRAFSERLFDQFGRVHGIARARREQAAEQFWNDFGLTTPPPE